MREQVPKQEEQTGELIPAGRDGQSEENRRLEELNDSAQLFSGSGKLYTLMGSGLQAIGSQESPHAARSGAAYSI